MSASRITNVDRTLLPEARLGSPMPWVIAIMSFLMVLAVASGWGLARSAASLGGDLAGRATVQIVEANPDGREAQAKAALDQLRRLSAVTRADRVDAERMRALLEPWLGREGLNGALPIPILIDVTMAKGSTRDMDELTRAVAAVAPSARVERHARLLAPIAQLLTTLNAIAIGLIMLMAVATAAAVVLAVRAALVTHRATIDVMHLMGASDRQIARMFLRRAASDAAFGSVIGVVPGALAVALVGAQLGRLDAAILRGAGLGWWGWLAIALVPVLTVTIAAVTARATVLRALAAAL